MLDYYGTTILRGIVDVHPDIPQRSRSMPDVKRGAREHVGG